MSIGCLLQHCNKTGNNLNMYQYKTGRRNRLIHVVGVHKNEASAYAGMERTPRYIKPEKEQNSKVWHKAFCIIFFEEESKAILGETKNFIFIQFKFFNHVYVLFLF